MGGEVKGKLANGVCSQLFTLPRNMVYPALLPLMRTPRLPVVDWTDVPADLNGLVRFAERRNLVSARVPSHFKRSLLRIVQAWTPWTKCIESKDNYVEKYFCCTDSILCCFKTTHCIFWFTYIHWLIHGERYNMLRWFVQKIQQGATVYRNLLFHIYMKLNMFWATRRPSSGA